MRWKHRAEGSCGQVGDMAAEISGLGMALVGMGPGTMVPVSNPSSTTCMTSNESHTLSVMPFPQVQKGFWEHQMR